MTSEDQYPTDGPVKFTRSVGKRLPAKEALRRVAAYRTDEENRGSKRGDYVESEFFGIDFINDLVKRNPGCIGIRFYYGINADDPDGHNARRLTLVAVDDHGKDLFDGGNLRGLKDDGDGDAGGDGYTCPKRCPA